MQTRTPGETNRREFMALALGAAALLAPRGASAADARIDVLPDEPIGRIAPEIYGHFVEHLGGVVYDGIWVGEDSKISNVGGIRAALVDHLKRVRPAVIRWPGGCFADSYNWRDGIGPRGSRPRRTNFWVDSRELAGVPAGPHVFDPNAFGTHEFARLCRLTGAQPYFAANLRSLPAKDFYEWVDYCNAPAGTTSLAEQRAGNGDRDPFGVRYWGVGNESWGCGGNFTAAEYAAEFRRFTAWVPKFGGPLSFIAAGPGSGDIEWTRTFFQTLTARGGGALGSLWGWGLHHYSENVAKGRTNRWGDRMGPAVAFDLEGWYELLKQADLMDGFITQHWQVMGEVDRDHRVKLAVDEWGSWHQPGTAVAPSHLFGQMSTLRDALVAGLTLDTFNRHADKVAMANVAQLVNCLHSLFLASEDRFVATPNFHVFEMYAAHQGATAVRCEISAPRVRYSRLGQPADFWGLAGSASRRDNAVVITVVNPHGTEPRETTVRVRGADIRGGQLASLASTDLRAHNTFDAPRTLEPVRTPLAPAGDGLTVRLPAASVNRIDLTLA